MKFFDSLKEKVGIKDWTLNDYALAVVALGSVSLMVSNPNLLFELFGFTYLKFLEGREYFDDIKAHANCCKP